MDADIKFLHRDKLVTNEEAATRAAFVAEGSTVRAFDSDEEFKNWGKHQTREFKSRASKAIRDLMRDKDKCNEDAIQSYNEKMKGIGRALNELADRTGLTPASEALFQRATLDRPPNKPEIFDQAIIYDGSNYSGEWLPITLYGGGAPDLTRVRGSFSSDWWGRRDWNDRISSVRMLGAGVLTEHNWYRGRWFWLMNYQLDITTPGPDDAQFNFNLSYYGFDNTASAMFLL